MLKSLRLLGRYGIRHYRLLLRIFYKVTRIVSGLDLLRRHRMGGEPVIQIYSVTEVSQNNALDHIYTSSILPLNAVIVYLYIYSAVADRTKNCWSLIEVVLVSAETPDADEIRNGEPLIYFQGSIRPNQWVNREVSHDEYYNMYKPIGSKPLRIGVRFNSAVLDFELQRVTVGYISP